MANSPIAPPKVSMDETNEVKAVIRDESSVVANKAFLGEQKKDNRFICSTAWDFLIPCNTCTILPERTNIVELYFGEYHGTITEPGCYCRNSWFVELRPISTALKTIDLPNIKVIDARGSPLIVSGLVTYEVVDARKAAIDVVDAFKYVADMAPTILKRVVSQFPYEARTDTPTETCLREDTDEVGNHMRDALQRRCNAAGVRIEQFAINELSYAPEIAQAMLKRQQAEALIDARRSIVEGAKQIAVQTVSDVELHISPEDRSKLLGNLLVVLVGEQDVTPTFNIGS